MKDEMVIDHARSPIVHYRLRWIARPGSHDLELVEARLEPCLAVL